MANSDKAADRKLAAQRAEELLDQLFFNIFEGHQDGQRILQDLQQHFYDRTSVAGTPVDANATLVGEGQRQVVLYIMGRIIRFQAGKK
jgi:ABC-type xylose transport system substrate-binding protein